MNKILNSQAIDRIKWLFRRRDYSRRAKIIAGIVVISCIPILMITSKIFALSIIPISTVSTASISETGEKIYFASETYQANATIDYATRQMDGYAWSADLGWVYFGSGDNNPEGPTYVTMSGHLAGKAKCISGGYIIFDSETYESNVTIESETGQFSGYAWSEDFGWVDFSNVSAPGFYLDTSAPDNPASVDATSTSNNAELTDNNYYNYSSIKFDWTAADDNAEVVDPTGVAAYYVYFGTDDSAVPFSAGTSVGTATTVTKTVALADDGETYYLRIQTVDNAGNKAVPVTLFTYKYDITKPTNPQYVSVSPVGWSTTDSFDFDWEDGTDPGQGASQIDHYEYKRDNGTDEWQETDSSSLSDVVSYKDGKNELFIRSVDKAGNIADSYLTAAYYFNGAAPKVPGDLMVASVSESVNSFSFSWSEPESNGGVRGYYYSVNAKPNINNSVYTTQLTTGYIPAATQQDLNTFYVVAIDNNGQINWGNYAEVGFECTTTAPGIPGALVISDSSNRVDDRWELTTSWRASTGSPDSYKVYRSTDGENFSYYSDTRSTGYLDTGLSNTSTYYYKVTAVDNAGAESAFSSIVSKMPTGKYTEPPIILSGPEYVATASSAVITWSTDRQSSSFVAYSKDKSFAESKGQLENVTSHKVILTGLEPGTKYNFKVQSLDENRDYPTADAFSEEMSFTTDVAPGISDVVISNVGLYSVTISFKTTTVATSEILYGPTNSYGTKISDNSGAGVTVHTINIENLNHSSLYHFKINGTDTDGNSLISDDYSFETLTFPRVYGLTFEQQKNTATSTLLVSWESNVPTSSTILVYEGNSATPRELSSASLAVKHSVVVTDLKDNTTYRMIAQGRDAYGNLAVSDENRVTTDYDTRPPVVSNIISESSTSGYGSNASSQVVISWDSDELSTSQVEYSEGVTGDSFSMSTPKDSSLTTSHVVIIRDLEPSSSYYFRVVSSDKSNNQTKSETGSVLTGLAQSSILDTVIQSLQNALGWMFK